MVQLHLRALHHLEAKAREAVDQLVHHQCDGVRAADFRQGPGFSYVNGFLFKRGLALGGLQGAQALVHTLGQPLAGLVDLRANGGALLG